MVSDHIGASKPNSSNLLPHLAHLTLSETCSGTQDISLNLINTAMKLSNVLFFAAGVYRVSATVSDAKVILPPVTDCFVITLPPSLAP